MQVRCKSNIPKHLGILLAAMLAISLFFIYMRFNPAESNWFPKCPFLQLTGLKCPGCGSQRAIHSLLNFKLLDAIKYNFMVIAAIPVLALFAYDRLTRRRHIRLHNLLNSSRFVIATGIIILIWWIVRNIFEL